jgi:molybdenum cofactor biosynthesis enzyme MoaA
VHAFDPERILRALARRRVRYVLIGATAARLQGFPRVTADADITPATDADNLKRLAMALRDLHARVYTESVPEGLPYDLDAASLARSELWNLVTDGGRVDIVFRPAGTAGYADLEKSAVTFEVYGLTTQAASLADILRSKLASDRPQDRDDVAVLKDMLRRTRK